MSKRKAHSLTHDDIHRYSDGNNQQSQSSHHIQDATSSTSIILNRGEGSLPYTLVNAGVTTQNCVTSNTNEVLTQIYQSDSANKLSLLLADSNMMSHASDQSASVADQIDKQYYVMLTPSTDQSVDKRAIAPRTQFTHNIEPTNARQARRRELHNEVERRRRDNINSWMVQLSKILPDCVFGDNDNRSKALTATSKGAILEKAVAYIEALKAANTSLGKQVNETQHLKAENDMLRRQVEVLKSQNDEMRATLERNGIGVETKFVEMG